MREILFRAKRKDTNEWIEGNYFKEEDRRWTETTAHYIIGFREHTDNIQKNTEIHIETLGQFIGIRDKNDKKVFEGDIIKSNFTEIQNKTKYEDDFKIINEKEILGVIEFLNGTFIVTWKSDFYARDTWEIPVEKYRFTRTTEACSMLNEFHTIYKTTPFEVVGNIHDNDYTNLRAGL